MDTENKDELARRVVARMMEQDRFSQWLGLRVVEVAEGSSVVEMTLREEMLNGFGVVHGGIAFSLADSAFAFACNNRNNLSMALDVSVNFTKALHPGDIIRAEAREVHNGRSTGLYLVTVRNAGGDTVALFKGTCFRTGKTLL